MEFVLVALAGLLIGLTANYFNYDRLELSRNYFSWQVTATRPAGAAPASAGTVRTAADTQPAAQTADAEYEAMAKRLGEYGVKLVSFAEAKALYEKPAYGTGAIVFVDARGEEDYLAGHVPGAFLLDHYRIERYIDEVIPHCQGAEKVVVYCNGGECEDSELVTIDLLNQGLEGGRLGVFAEGMQGWENQKMPIELGERHSGVFKEGGHE